MQGEFRPDLRPLWLHRDGGTFAPVLDDDGVQQMVSVPSVHTLAWPCGPGNSRITQEAWFSLTHTGEIGSKIPARVMIINQAGNLEKAIDVTLVAHVRQGWALPPETDKIRVEFGAGRWEPVGWCWEKLAKV